jgi:hypothetical protein
MTLSAGKLLYVSGCVSVCSTVIVQAVVEHVQPAGGAGSSIVQLSSARPSATMLPVTLRAPR